MAVVTRDRRIRERRKELRMVREHGAKLIALASQDAGSTFAQLEVVTSHWRDLERLAVGAGPFVYTASRTSLKAVLLDDQ